MQKQPENYLLIKKTMKTTILKTTLIIASLFSLQSKSQVTAMDFNRNDCNGNPQHLFADLNSGKVVIIEFFMTSCAGCPAAGIVLENMKTNLLQQYPGKIRSYAIGFNNTYSCSVIKNWVTSNGFTSIPMDSGAVQVAYYGGMGMPTIVIAAGTNHQLLGSPYIGFNNTDTTAMAGNIRTFLNSQVGIKENAKTISKVVVYPNPASTEVRVDLSLNESANVKIDVIDIAGRVVLSTPIENITTSTFSKQLNIASFQAGNYTIKISSNGSVTSQKLNIVR